MQNKMKISLIILFISTLFAISFAAEKTVVLQNGVDGYEGCSDSYMESKGQFDPDVGDLVDVPLTDPMGADNNLKIAE